MYYVKSRYYDPEICRWISADDASNLGIEGEFVSYNVFVYCGDNPVQREDDGGEFWNVVVGALIGGAVSLVSTAITAKATGEELTTADYITSFAAGAVSGGLAATGIGVVASTAINAGTTFGCSVASDYFSGRKIDWGKAAVATACSVVGSIWSGNGIRHSEGAYKQALNAVDSATAVWRESSKGYSRKAANMAMKKAISFANDIYLDNSYVLLGKTLATGLGSTAFMSAHLLIWR